MKVFMNKGKIRFSTIFAFSVVVFLLNGCGWQGGPKLWVSPKHWYFSDNTQRLDEMVRTPEKSSNGKVNFISVHRENPRIVFAGTDGGIFKSQDKGNEWFPINRGISNYKILSFLQDPKNPDILYIGVRKSAAGIGGIYKSNDGGLNWTLLSGGPKGFSIHALLVDSQGIYAGSYGAGLFFSPDGGKHWQSLNEGLDRFAVFSLVQDSLDSDTLLAGTERGLFILNKMEKKWRGVSMGSGGGVVLALAMDPSTPGKIYVGTEKRGLFISSDGGETWKIAEGLRKARVSSVLVFSSLLRGDHTSPVFAAVGSSIYRSEDAGESWQKFQANPGTFSFPPSMKEGSPFPLSLAQGSSPSPMLYTGWDQGRGVIGIDLSLRASSSWSALNNGLVNASIMDLLVSKNQPSLVIAATWGRGLIRSRDGGKHWEEINTGFDSTIALSIAQHPKIDEILYAGSQDSIFKSIDGGSHWQKVEYSIRRPIDIAIDPKDPEIIYVASWGDGFLKSSDGGEHWVNLSDDLEVRRAYSIAIDPIQTDILYLGTDFDLYKSMDGGRHWKRLKVRPTQVVLLDPSDPSTIYAGTCKWIFKSIDGGESWTIKREGMMFTDVYSLAVDPENPNVVYAGTYEGGVFKSVDGADHWTQISEGLTNQHVYSMALDSNNPEILYTGTFSTTFSSGVFKTENKGEEWVLTHPGASQFTNKEWVSGTGMKKETFPNNKSAGLFLP